MAAQTEKRIPASQLSVLAVVIITLAALGLGLVLKGSIESKSNPIQNGSGITGQIPEGWIIQDGKGELVFNAYSPFKPYERMTVFLLDDKEGIPLADVAGERDQQLAASLTSYRILEEQAVERKGKQGYKVNSAYIDDKAQGIPRVIQGVDYYFASNGKILVVTWRTDAAEYEDGLPAFLRVLDSIEYNPGG